VEASLSKVGTKHLWKGAWTLTVHELDDKVLRQEDDDEEENKRGVVVVNLLYRESGGSFDEQGMFLARHFRGF